MVSSVVALRAAVLAALVAGGVLGLFHLTVSEPVIDRAIAREERMRAGEDHGQEVFSRRTQKAGLIAGSVTFALALGLIFGGVYAAAGEWLPGGTPGRRVLLLVGVGLWVFYLAPFFKYPPNPPGVGDPDTVYERQALYLLLLLLVALGLIVAGLLRRALLRSGARSALATAVALGTYAGYVAALWLVMPTSPDPNDAPASLLRQFRGASAVGMILFWAAFGLVFAAVLQRADQRAARDVA